MFNYIPNTGVSFNYVPSSSPWTRNICFEQRGGLTTSGNLAVPAPPLRNWNIYVAKPIIGGPDPTVVCGLHEVTSHVCLRLRMR